MSQTQRVPTDDAFRLLACRQRRVVLRLLRDSERTMTRDELVGRVERTVPGDVSVTFAHRDLPMLEQYGLIEFDESESVTYRPDEFVELLLAWAEPE